jgi:hypothetical protein
MAIRVSAERSSREVVRNISTGRVWISGSSHNVCQDLVFLERGLEDAYRCGS